MFTGLIQSRGKITSLTKTSQTMVLTCQAPATFLSDYFIGDSMAINGVCLTAVATTPTTFTVEMMPETFNRTTFSHLKINSSVNLEKALAYNGRVEGHFVAGHVDTMVRLINKTSQGKALLLTFSLPSTLQNQVIPQGSIAINGVSLTVITKKAGTFSIGLIPHSKEITNLGCLIQGELVNIETDMLGKYIINSTIHFSERTLHYDK